MARRGPKPSYLALVDASAPARFGGDSATVCGGLTKKGTTCRRKTGGPRCPQHADQPSRTPDCPMPLTELQRLVWDDVLAQLQELRLWHPAFWPSVFGLVVALTALQEAASQIDSLTVPDRGGSRKRNPAVTAALQLLAQVRAFASELGLTAAARARLGPSSKGAPSRLEQLIRGDL